MIDSAGGLLAASDANAIPGADLTVPWWAWLAFVALIAALLVLDLKVFHRHAHVIGFKEAAWFSVFWIALGLAFTAVIWFWLGG